MRTWVKITTVILGTAVLGITGLKIWKKGQETELEDNVPENTLPSEKPAPKPAPPKPAPPKPAPPEPRPNLPEPLPIRKDQFGNDVVDIDSMTEEELEDYLNIEDRLNDQSGGSGGDWRYN
jgi:hypothetical protein